MLNSIKKLGVKAVSSVSLLLVSTHSYANELPTGGISTGSGSSGSWWDVLKSNIASGADMVVLGLSLLVAIIFVVANIEKFMDWVKGRITFAEIGGTLVVGLGMVMMTYFVLNFAVGLLD